MVYNGKPYEQMDDLGGKHPPQFLGWHPYGLFSNDSEIGNLKDLDLIVDFFFKMDYSGQIIATSHDLNPNGGLVREIPLLGWWNIIIRPDYW